MGSIELPSPNSIVSKYEYDPETDRYIYTESVGEFNINYPIILTPREFENLVLQENLKTYYKQKIDAADGKKTGTEDEQKNLLPEFYVNSDFFESLFGSNTIEVIPQGSVEMDLGVLFTKQDNPSFSPRNRRNFSFDFDQRISLSLLGKVGTRLQVTANYDTQSTFDFQNLVKLEYTPTEDDILQKIEVGNVSMPLNSSLITGAQSLFGVKTELQFGKTRVTAVFSEQKSQTRSVTAQGGGTLEEFQLFARDYDENRHFFLAHYFRDNYDEALANYPFINTNVQITRAEVWITNRSNRTDNVRNIVAIQDLGEANPENVGLDNQAGFFTTGNPNAFPDNSVNNFNPETIGTTSFLTEQIRDIATVQAGFGGALVNEGFDYNKLENARKLTQGQEYTLNTELGYISLNQRLNNDEVLAVAFQYTIGGEVYQVGEFANDGVEATDIGVDNNGNQTITNQNLVLKMLKSSITNVQEPIWDIMMKNIYDIGAFQLSREDFKLNIFYTETSPLNYITPTGLTPFPDQGPNNDAIEETTLLRLFNLDRLNFNNDPQAGGDGFFDYVPGITVLTQNGKIIFTNVEPFGEYLFDRLALGPEDYEIESSYNENQEKYVYNTLYSLTKTAALEDFEKNKFELRGRYKSDGGGGIPLGAFNVPRGSVKVTAGGRTLVEGVDYTVNYQIGMVQIIDPALEASNTPIQVSVENNAIFGQQTRRFTGLNVEHQFNENFVLGATFLNLNERPITQKANYNSEPINNTILGLNGNFSTEVPFLTRLANKLPNIDTDAPSNFSVRGEFAYLLPGAPKGTDFQGEATSYIDDFEGSQNSIDLRAPQSWFLSSTPVTETGYTIVSDPSDAANLQNGFFRSKLNWYTIDPIFYTSQRPSGITDDDVSDLYTRRVFIEEIFPQIDIIQGQQAVVNTLDLAYYPSERGPYNFSTDAEDGVLSNPEQTWAGITRQLTTTDFEQSNVEYIEFWLQDPFLDNTANPGGTLSFNLGSISEDILTDGRKQYENGLPDGTSNNDITSETSWGLVPANQSLIYAFDTTGDARIQQDVGYDGLSDESERANPNYPPAFATLEDPSNDNYQYYLNRDGDIFERYSLYNGQEGNSPETISDTNRGSTTQPDVEDINRDNTMNTIDSYFEYNIPISPFSLSDINNEFIRDRKIVDVALPNGSTRQVVWYQFRIPTNVPLATFDDPTIPEYQRYNGIADFRSIRFIRMFLQDFSESTVLRFGTLDLVRGDWRRYNQLLTGLPIPPGDETEFSQGVVSIQDNEGSYVSPPGVVREQLFNNNTVQRQNEQSLVLNVCELQPKDGRAVFKNINVDMRQYKRLRMFIHAEEGTTPGLSDGDLVGFIRMGNDFSQNFYQIEIPLQVSTGTSASEIWPEVNEINLQLELLQQIKSRGISNGTLSNLTPTYYDAIDGQLTELPVNEFDPRVLGQTRLGIKGNPNFGDIRTLMVGVKNGGSNNVCGQVWFNELRISDLDNEGGWAAIVSMDGNIADFANVSATGRQSTTGFGTIEQGPNERSREDIKQYDVVTNVNIGQLLPKKWGVQIPFNYAQSEEIITPEFDQQYKDLTLDTRLDNAANDDERDLIRTQSEDYTKRKSINFIGVRKQRTGEAKPRFYDVENFTFNYSFNQIEHRDFEIENSLDQSLRVGANYSYNFEPVTFEPFKKNDSLFTGKYWKFLKDFNVNLLPSSFTLTTDINRLFNKQKFREVDLTGGNIGLEELFRRNYTFDFSYTLNYDLTKSLRLNFTASNNNIVRNYFVNDIINGEQDPDLNVWDGFFDFGDPNRQYQQFGLTYELPFSKIPTFSFLSGTYAYTGDFQWQKGSDLYGNIQGNDGNNYNLGNTIQNSNTHNLNASLDMGKLYKYLGLVKKPLNTTAATNRQRVGGPPGIGNNQNPPKPKKPMSKSGRKLWNGFIDGITMIKRIQVNYTENNGTFLPGYLQTPGFIGTLKPTIGYTFGSQRDIRDLAARNGWLTVFPDFNQQYTEVQNRILDISASIEPVRDLKIDVVANRRYSENLTENFNTTDGDGDGLSDVYNSLIQNSFGNFDISTMLIRTAFKKSDEFSSAPFETFKENRLIIANRLAREFYGNTAFNIDADGFPEGFGKTNQAVLLPALLSAYSGQSADKVKLGAFRDVPIPNWNLKYTGFMKFKWFKKQFKRFSVTHGYRSNYTINQFRSNLDYVAGDPLIDYASQQPEVLDQSGNYKNRTLFTNVNLMEQFSPLIRLDFEMKNSIKILAELKKDRVLSLSFDNNLLTEIIGSEYIIGLGYRIKDVRIKSKLAGPNQTIKSDLNMKADISLRDNKTIIRYLDLDNNQITSGQTIWGLKFSSDYAFSKNLTGIFYFDYTFSDYAISTAFPQTTIRSGLTLRYNFGN
ncbi:MAG: cell surface protein SprA [Flavobacteriaceae bacterium]|nr:cell surface protein SprA [Flavobacteriaceae bacterium]